VSAASWIARDLPPIIRDGTEYFLLSHDDALYLVENRCPHRGGPLKFGFVNAEDEIVCPLHQGAFPISRLIAAPNTIRLLEREPAIP
jgi:nitrite reductase/ring-hydroxylating ferredoxin subunit